VLYCLGLLSFVANSEIMNVLLLGSGGREHALAMKLVESPSCDKLFIAPGNPGTAECGQNVELKLNDFKAVESFLDEQRIDLIVVGPEQPLVDGLGDQLQASGALENRVFFGPGAKGADLEGSKSFAKAFMQRHHIPTAAYASFGKESKEEAKAYLKTMKAPYVIKADGLAAGKGVIITSDLSEAEQVVLDLFEGSLGDAGKTLVLEEFLSGIELSVFVMTNGEDMIWLPEAKDYKRIGEGDTGPNTGGMGSLSPVPFFDEKLRTKVQEQIVLPTIKGLKEESISYLGFIFFGLIVVEGEPYVIEYNVRMGDPETQSVMPRVKGDFAQAMWSLGRGEGVISLETDSKCSASVVLVSEGYPGSYEKGKEIKFDALDKVRLVHAGTKEQDGQLITNGGRVLAVNSLGADLEECFGSIYQEIGKIHFEGMSYRSDIGKDLA
jgi:phosphoribosylamine--glycine ligase